MTTDDLKAVADKYPEWATFESDDLCVVRIGGDDCRVDLFDGHGGMTAAIFSALLDEIAEDLGYKLTEEITGGHDPTWYYRVRKIQNGGEVGHGPTKLEALLSL